MTRAASPSCRRASIRRSWASARSSVSRTTSGSTHGSPWYSAYAGPRHSRSASVSVRIASAGARPAAESTARSKHQASTASGSKTERVAGRLADDHSVASTGPGLGLEASAEVADVGLDRTRGVGGWVVTPDAVGEAFGADGLVAQDDQPREDGTLTSAAQVDDRTVAARRKLAEDAKPHSRVAVHSAPSPSLENSGDRHAPSGPEKESGGIVESENTINESARTESTCRRGRACRRIQASQLTRLLRPSRVFDAGVDRSSKPARGSRTRQVPCGETEFDTDASWCWCVIASAIVGALIAAAFSWRSCSRSTARPFLVVLRDPHAAGATRDMWQRPGIWGYCWHSVGPVPADADEHGHIGDRRRRARETDGREQPPALGPAGARRTPSCGGGLGAQCSARVPQVAALVVDEDGHQLPHS